MTTSKNRLRLDFKDLPDLKAALGGVPAGERIKVEFEIMVVSNDDDSLEGDIEGVEYDTGAEDEADEGKGSVETSSEEPILAVISKRNAAKKKATAKPAKPDADDEDDV